MLLVYIMFGICLKQINSIFLMNKINFTETFVQTWRQNTKIAWINTTKFHRSCDFGHDNIRSPLPPTKYLTPVI